MDDAEAPDLRDAVRQGRPEVRHGVCGVRVEEDEDPRMRKLRDLDTLIDEPAKGEEGRADPAAVKRRAGPATPLATAPIARDVARLETAAGGASRGTAPQC